MPWHRIENELGQLDWSWIDGPLQLMRELKMQPILDPLHHISFPDWLENGFAKPQFPHLYTNFVEKVAERYDWVDRYTVVNEPLPTLVLCALTGAWYPHHRSERSFVLMAINVARAICLASETLRKLNPQIQLIQIDSCEHHRALDDGSRQWVQWANQRRFLFHDLVLGRIDSDHFLLTYLHANGFEEDDRRWFQDHAVPIDVLGLDYYAHSEMDWTWNDESGSVALSFPCSQARGFASVAGDYVDRYRLPVFLSETNIGGTVRSSSELSDWYVRLARGEARGGDLPSYPLEPPLDRDLRGFLPLMKGH